MPIKINNLTINLDEDLKILKNEAAKKLNIDETSIEKFRILRESVDARRKNKIKFNYIVEVQTQNEKKLMNKIHDKNVVFNENKQYNVKFGTKKLTNRPVIVGMGPGGMFAGLILSKFGYKPFIVERGEKVEDRKKTIEKFWNTGQLNPESNVQFGEGGAGTFSDGKLTTRTKDSRCRIVFETFARYGAPEEILYSGKPHIGTDILKSVVRNIRNEIEKNGGEILFNTKFNDLKVKNGKLESITIDKEEIPCDDLVLAIGHSSRDTYKMLFNKNIFMEQKPFAVGVRVEHLQHMIDVNQYGKYAGHPRLGASDYRLTSRGKNGRGVYSFCMCPGGEVVAASSEDNMLVTNGMSNYKRDGKNANSAVVVTVGKNDFEDKLPLRGMEFQRHYERMAYRIGGGNYEAPVQLIRDFLEDNVSVEFGNVKPSYRRGYNFADLRRCLPQAVIEALKDGFVDFERKIKGFSSGDGVIIGIETRTSAPVRISRNENLESISAKGIYPCGEGAGFAGGIISSAIDGIKVAEKIMCKYKPF
ncbi:NAD(P)/FAD-dependent oxidoreductase [Clostridium sp. LBM24168]